MAELRAYVEDNDLEGYLFPGGVGHITAHNMRRQLKKYLAKAGLSKHVTPHTFRHSIAVHYLMGGAPITFVQGLLGHESLATTGIYTQLVDQMAKEITLSTKTTIDGVDEAETSLKEVSGLYKPEFEEWDAFASEILEWLGRP